MTQFPNCDQYSSISFSGLQFLCRFLCVGSIPVRKRSGLLPLVFSGVSEPFGAERARWLVSSCRVTTQPGKCKGKDSRSKYKSGIFFFLNCLQWRLHVWWWCRTGFTVTHPPFLCVLIAVGRRRKSVRRCLQSRQEEKQPKTFRPRRHTRKQRKK